MRTRRLAGPIVLLSAGLVLCSLLAAPPDDGRRFALVVAVQDYSGTDLGNLKYADNDGNELADLLRQQGYRRVVLMTRSEALKQDKDDLDPRADAVRLQLKSLLEDCREGDTVLVAFAGHGVQLNKDGKFYFCPRRANLDDPKTLVALDEVYADMKDCRASAKLLVADACRNDPLEGKAAGDSRLKSVTRPALEKPDGGVLALFSCSEGQRAFESDALKHGVFFHYFLEGLRGKAADPKTGEVELLDLVKYVRDEVPVTVKEERGAQYKQKPNFLGDLNDKVVLARVDGAASPPDTRVETAEKDEAFDYTIDGVTKHGTRRVLSVDLGGGVKMEFVRIPHGTFLMGSPDSDKDALGWEKPRHEVEITRDFYLGKYLVTKKQFGRFVAAKGYKTEAETDGKGGFGWDGKTLTPDPKYTWRNPGFEQTDEHPVVIVTWNDAAAFCDWASGAAKHKVVLPTEAQWEYACRAGTTTRYFTGDAPESLEGSANVADQSAKKQFPNWTTFDFDDGYVFTSPVGRFVPNRFGLYDMTGDAWEWCSDYYDSKYYGNSDKKDPENTTKTGARVVRGGSWGNDAEYCRAAYSFRFAPGSRSGSYGLRVCFCLD